MSRLTALAKGAAVDTGGLAAFNFRDMGGWHLLTNEWGQFLMLSTADFERFMAGKVGGDDPLYPELESRGFLKARLDFRQLAANYVKKNSFQWFPGPSLHMIVVTLRCNQKCQYCHSSVVDPSRTDTDMDVETARKTVDFIFSTPNPTICIEFQGGEPLLNWPVVKFITEYAQAKAKAGNRKLLMALVCNFTLMTEDKLDFLFDHHVSICTSLDGPAELHNKNRPFLGGGEAQQKVVHWLEKIQERCNADEKKKYYLPGALMTTTRFSMDYGPQIVDLYVKLGLEQIFLRPLSPIGYAKRVWKDVGYEAEEFVRFYEKTLDYVIDLNISGKSNIMERMALILLSKIVKGEDPGFMDLRSPAGAVLGCLAYNYNGEIFVSDEGRMVDHQGDPIFKVGDTAESDWTSVIDHPTTRACVTASTLDNQPMCHQCAFKPYCGVEPVFHYETQKSVFGQMPTSGWCVSHMGVFDVIFRKLRDPRARKVMDKWLERDQCRWQESEAVPAGQPEVVR
ncbi:MAG: His-Xaa-Ser system radical SAM maturase HxsB [Elusimicrobia bacterium]|nr:His-Xaa-Ser system radical SAM maturase HxsB [Elusimicrobiota bacterium]